MAGIVKHAFGDRWREWRGRSGGFGLIGWRGWEEERVELEGSC